jgi:hypothetical protein
VITKILFSGKRKGRIYSSFLFPTPILLFFFSTFLYSSSLYYCVTKMYRTHQKWRIAVSWHLSGVQQVYFSMLFFPSFKILLESVSCFSYSVILLLRLTGTKFCFLPRVKADLFFIPDSPLPQSQFSFSRFFSLCLPLYCVKNYNKSTRNSLLSLVKCAAGVFFCDFCPKNFARKR